MPKTECYGSEYEWAKFCLILVDFIQNHLITDEKFQFQLLRQISFIEQNLFLNEI